MFAVRTQFDPHERVFSNLGTREKILYSPQFDKDGRMELVESGRENLYEYIQSHKESVDIHVILERFARGDISALSRVQGTYGDFTKMPQTYAEFLNARIFAENYFNSLSVETRAKFDHSFERFLVSLDDPQLLVTLGLATSPNSSQQPKETVVEQPSAPAQNFPSAE